MNGHDECGSVREWLPDHAAGRLDQVRSARVDGHVASCEECREELDLIVLLRAGTPGAPEGLSDRVVQAVTSRRRPAHRPWWGLSAAAVAAIALGIGIASDQGGVPTAGSSEGFASEFEEGEFWVSDDAMLAGAPTLEELTDEELAALLEELLAETPGGEA